VDIGVSRTEMIDWFGAFYTGKKRKKESRKEGRRRLKAKTSKIIFIVIFPSFKNPDSSDSSSDSFTKSQNPMSKPVLK
jgi:hypothetical protein